MNIDSRLIEKAENISTLFNKSHLILAAKSNQDLYSTIIKHSGYVEKGDWLIADVNGNVCSVSEKDFISNYDTKVENININCTERAQLLSKCLSIFSQLGFSQDNIKPCFKKTEKPLFEAIDAHSHVGNDMFHKLPGVLDEYTSISNRLGVNTSLLMPCPCPTYKYRDMVIVPLTWKKSGRKMSYYQSIISDNSKVITRKITNPIDPYKMVNLKLKEQIEQYTSKSKLYYVPLVHPIFDNITYLENLLEQKPVALKVHGVAAGINPNEVSETFYNLLRKYQVPVIIHTDFVKSGSFTTFDMFRNANAPSSWIQILLKHEIPALLTHGVRLCKDTIKIINKETLFRVGIAPDLLLNHEKDRLYSSDGYLETLLNSVNFNRLVFDVDYPWNIDSRDTYNFDCKSLDRIKAVIKDQNILKDILFNNAKSFFKL